VRIYYPDHLIFFTVAGSDLHTPGDILVITDQKVMLSELLCPSKQAFINGHLTPIKYDLGTLRKRCL